MDTGNKEETSRYHSMFCLLYSDKKVAKICLKLSYSTNKSTNSQWVSVIHLTD